MLFELFFGRIRWGLVVELCWFFVFEVWGVYCGVLGESRMDSCSLEVRGLCVLIWVGWVHGVGAWGGSGQF